MKILRETVLKTALDISVTEALIERWHKEGLHERLCKD
jgi:hypothetical protein